VVVVVVMMTVVEVAPALYKMLEELPQLQQRKRQQRKRRKMPNLRPHLIVVCMVSTTTRLRSVNVMILGSPLKSQSHAHDNIAQST